MPAPMASDQYVLPSHVPRELVSDFDFWQSPGMDVDPHATIMTLRDGPRVLYLPHNATGVVRPAYSGWLPTRPDDIITAYKDTDTFSNRGNGDMSSAIGEDWILGPDAMDPPDHTKYRAILNPLFTPRALSEMEDKIRTFARELIDRVAGQGGCDYVEAFGRPFPITIFMQLMGLPLTDYDTLQQLEYDMLHSQDGKKYADAVKQTSQYLRDLMVERRRRPTNDLISTVVTAKVDDRPLTDTEAIGFLMLMFVAGLDTVLSTSSFAFKHLAQHPESQKRLRENPSLIRNAVEELLRCYATVIPCREVTRDVEFAGVKMKKGDRLILATMLASRGLDLDRTDEVVLDRENANRHMAFGAGPHLCVGMYLARRELIIALEEWLTRIPPFRLKSGTTPKVHGGVVFGVDRLDLSWA